MTDVRVEGTQQLTAVARRLKETGDGQLRKELLGGLRRAAAPLVAEVRASAASTLPKKGGLNQVVAGGKVSISTSLTDNPRVRIIAKLGKSNLRLIDRGQIRHPVFGHREVWVTSSVHPGFFSSVMMAAGPQVRSELLKVIADVRAKVEHG